MTKSNDHRARSRLCFLGSACLALAPSTSPERSVIGRQEPGDADREWTSIPAMDALDPSERGLRRRAREEAEWNRIRGELPEGWIAEEVDGVRVVRRPTKKARNHAKNASRRVRAVMTWLEESFEYVGSGEYVRTPILRVDDSASEPPPATMGLEISVPRPPEKDERVSRDHAPGFGTEWMSIDRRVVEIWFQDRDRRLYWALPCWFHAGVLEMVESADHAGSKLKPKRSYTEETLQKLARENDHLYHTCQELMHLKRADYDALRGEEKEPNWAPWAQSVALMRFFLDGPGAKKKKTRQVLPDLCAHLGDVLRETGIEVDGRENVRSDEQEREYLARESSAFERAGDAALDSALERTFAEWEAADWRALEKAYEPTLR